MFRGYSSWNSVRQRRHAAGARQLRAARLGLRAHRPLPCRDAGSPCRPPTSEPPGNEPMRPRPQRTHRRTSFLCRQVRASAQTAQRRDHPQTHTGNAPTCRAAFRLSRRQARQDRPQTRKSPAAPNAPDRRRHQDECHGTQAAGLA